MCLWMAHCLRARLGVHCLLGCIGTYEYKLLCWVKWIMCVSNTCAATYPYFTAVCCSWESEVSASTQKSMYLLCYVSLQVKGHMPAQFAQGPQQHLAINFTLVSYCLQLTYIVKSPTSFSLWLQYPLCLSLKADKAVNLQPLITHRLGFSEQDVAKGFDIAMRSAETKAIKVMFQL